MNLLENRIRAYKKEKIDLEQKIKNSAISLEDDFRAINYDGVGGAYNTSTSPQDKAVEKAFLILEKKLTETNDEILFIQEKINELKRKNNDIEYILRCLDLEYIKILEYMYKSKKGSLAASIDLAMDRVTIYRKRNKAFKEIGKYFDFL